jgi:hypothetical protein
MRTIAAFAILASTATSLNAQMVATGRYQIRPVTPPAACLKDDQGFGARLPFVKHVQCPPGPANEEANFWWDITRQPDGRYLMKHSFSDLCATVARGVIFGPPAIDLRRCENPIPADQLFKLEAKSGGVFEFRTANGKCWYWRNEAYGSEHIQRDCGASAAFRLVPAG